jgi:hypothetical protein
MAQYTVRAINTAPAPKPAPEKPKPAAEPKKPLRGRKFKKEK